LITILILKSWILIFLSFFSKLADRSEKLLQLVIKRVSSKSQMHGVVRKWRHAICDILSPETLWHRLRTTTLKNFKKIITIISNMGPISSTFVRKIFACKIWRLFWQMAFGEFWLKISVTESSVKLNGEFFATFCLAKKFGEIDPWGFEKYGNINHQTSSKATFLSTFQEVG
jgi:hypothetical protein